jgi:hypothetical protein
MSKNLLRERCIKQNTQSLRHLFRKIVYKSKQVNTQSFNLFIIIIFLNI